MGACLDELRIKIDDFTVQPFVPGCLPACLPACLPVCLREFRLLIIV